MTNEEMEKLHFERAVEITTISTHAMLRTVLQNQMIIMKSLKIGNNDTIVQEINDNFSKNVDFIESVLKNSAQESVKIIFPASGHN